jgi:hypothetical protein
MLLFYIPWDPNVDQTTEMAAYSESVFRERVLSSFITKIGKTSLPATIDIEYDDLLNDATFQFYERWKSKNIVQTLRKSCSILINKAINDANGHFQKTVLAQSRKGFSLQILNNEDKELIIDSITQFKQDKWIKVEELEQPDMFDNLKEG